MNIEQRLTNLESRLDSLQASFIQAQKNQVPVTAKTDDAVSGVERLTPYTETKTAYYLEKEKTFYDVPNGNLTVYFDNYNGSYSVSRIANRVTVSFDTLTESTNITISVN